MKKKVIIPSICFAVLSTPAFEKVIHAAQPEAPVKEVAPASTKTEYADITPHASLNVHSSPSVDSPVIAKIANGTEVMVYSEEDGWAKVEVNGKEGYVKADYLAATPVGYEVQKKAPAEAVTKYVNVNEGSNLNLREGASADTAIIGKLPKGTSVTVLHEEDGWAKVKVNGKEGYVSSKYLVAGSAAGKGSSPAETGLAKTNAPQTTVQNSHAAQTSTKYVNVDPGSYLNLREGASTSSSSVGKLARGTEVTVYSEENGWAKVRAAGKEGYVSSKYLTVSNPASTAQKAQAVTKYVSVDPGSRLILRQQPSTSAAELDRLANGSKVTVYSEANGWAKVKANGKDGYVSSQFLSSSQPSSTTVQNTTKYVDVNSGSSLNMRSGPSTSSSVISKLSDGTKVTVHSEANGWAKVTANGKTGYVSTKYLSNTQQVEKKAGAPAQKVPTPSLNGNIKTVYQNYNISFDRFAQIQMSANPKKKSAGWVNATSGDVRYFLNPSNFLNSSSESLQFLKLSASANLNANEVNAKILAGKGILEGKASAFIEAGKKYGINEIYLIAHALLETGNGSSTLAKGVQVNGKTVYNMYGIGASDGNSGTNGAQRAYQEGWFSPEAAIMGGAEFIAQKYIYAGQDTLYEMRWNPGAAASRGVATHQYATDVAWAVKQARIIYKYSSMINTYDFTLEIPRFN